MFSERQVDVLGEWAGDADCTVIAYASVLPKLRDRQQLYRTDSQVVEVQGDIQVVQNSLKALADPAEFDPAELLAPIPVISPLKESAAAAGGAKFLHHGIKRQQRYVYSHTAMAYGTRSA